MPDHRSAARSLTATVLLLLAAGGAAPAGAETEAAGRLMWLRQNSCTRVERATGYVDAEGECLRHHPAFGDDVRICAAYSCAAGPGEPGAHIIHPTDFGPTD